MSTDIVDRLRGVAVGAAIGDALGMPLERGLARPDEPVRGREVSCDARLFAGEHPRMPVLTFGADHLEHAHSDRERIHVKVAGRGFFSSVDISNVTCYTHYHSSPGLLQCPVRPKRSISGYVGSSPAIDGPEVLLSLRSGQHWAKTAPSTTSGILRLHPANDAELRSGGAGFRSGCSRVAE